MRGDTLVRLSVITLATLRGTTQETQLTLVRLWVILREMLRTKATTRELEPLPTNEPESVVVGLIRSYILSLVVLNTYGDLLDSQKVDLVMVVEEILRMNTLLNYTTMEHLFTPVVHTVVWWMQEYQSLSVL